MVARGKLGLQINYLLLKLGPIVEIILGKMKLNFLIS